MVNLYPDIVHEGDLSPDAFGPEIEEACKEIHKACKGFGTDEKRLINALATKSPEDRYKISIKYKEIYGQELKTLMRKEVGGDLGTALQFLAVPSNVAECDMIKKACKGLGTNELVLYPIIAGRTNEEIDILKKTFFNENTTDLGRYLDRELGGNFEKLVFCALQGTEEAYDPDYHTEERVEEVCERIHKAGQGKIGTDEATMIKNICAAPPQFLKEVNLAYADKYGYTITKALEKELGGQTEDAALYLVGMKIKPYETAAKLINKACAGFGTNELLLTCCLIRYQMILKEVDAAHVELYGQSIHDRVKDETRGKYETLLLAVIDAAP